MFHEFLTLARLVGEDIRLVAAKAAVVLRPQHAKLELNGVTLTLGSWTTLPILRQIRDRRYEAPERKIVMATVRPGDTVLELGSGTGYVTTIAAGIASEVRSFDANPQIVAVAQSTVAANGRHATVSNGVMSRNGAQGTAPFYLSPHFPQSSLVPFEDARVIEVPVIPLTEALEGCTYLIADIEGAEVELLAGELPGVERICVECHPQRVGLAALIDMVGKLQAQGFELSPEISDGHVLYLERSGEAAGQRASSHSA